MVSRRQQVSSLIVAMLILASCTSGGDDVAPGEDPDGGLPSPNPLDVVIRADPANGKAKVLGPQGGTLNLHLADGTDVELDVPAGALAFETEIGISPVVAIDGWDFAPAGLASVQLSPDGLDLFVPASLTFQRSSAEPDSASGQIAWAGEGTDLHPVLGSDLPNGATIPIEHFSGYGFVWNLDMGYWGQWEQYRGRTWEAWIEQNIAKLLGMIRQKQMMGITESLDVTYEGMMITLSQWYDWVYTSLMASAETSCAAGRAAAIAQIFLARKIALMGGDLQELWQRFSEQRRENGQQLPFTFDGLPFDFVDKLVAACDREALEACLLTGDLGLLLVYVKDRNDILELSGRSPPSARDGSELIEECGRYHVDFDVTSAIERLAKRGELAGPKADTPTLQEKERWRVRLSIDLRWERAGTEAAPWIGRIIGEAVPEWTGLGSQTRYWSQSQNDQGQVFGGHWEPWCVRSYAIGPWKPWPVELKGLDFVRERAQRPLPPPPPWVIEQAQEKAERLGPTFNYDLPLKTSSFKSATLVFHELPGPSMTSACGPGAGGSLTSGFVPASFLYAQPLDTKWNYTREGLSASPVELNEDGSHPVIARRVWMSGRPPPNDDPYVTDTYEWKGEVLLTHTATSRR